MIPASTNTGPVSTRATAACLACAPLAAPSGNEWACSEYCTDPSLITSGARLKPNSGGTCRG
ncbi:hypothetical protein HaLaN_00443 [Haematococcus lacustris]|uniref:Uncharacterized protein n=1 Tax=Haematococcus lacustris TaxID=44745 RepID=A0A699Y9B7_HAELA|nr:hypothetical protein HaLaN_00443 [Haematococcus lacustris]